MLIFLLLSDKILGAGGSLGGGKLLQGAPPAPEEERQIGLSSINLKAIKKHGLHEQWNVL